MRTVPFGQFAQLPVFRLRKSRIVVENLFGRLPREGEYLSVLAQARDLQVERQPLIAANPPYRNSGKVRRVATAACHELTATLEDFFRAAAYLVKYRGRFAIVQLPERFTECMELALKYGLQPKKLQWVHAFADKPAWIFLMEMVKGGSYGLEVLPPLIMYNEDGSHSKQTLEYYGMAEEAE